jgi:hypothetical protein
MARPIAPDFKDHRVNSFSSTVPHRNQHALRTLFNFRQLDASGNTIAIVDTPYNIAIAERLVSDLDKPGGEYSKCVM